MPSSVKDSAVIRYHGTHAAAVLDEEEVCMTARAGDTEIRLLYGPDW